MCSDHPSLIPALRNFFFSTAWIVILAAFPAGCTLSLNRQVVSLNCSDACPGWTEAELLANIARFDDTTGTETLECALDLLRNTQGAAIVKSSAGAQLCFLLADRTVTDPARREGYAAEGVRRAEAALAGGAEGSGELYYYLAVNLGIAVREHPGVALKNLGRLVKSLKKALELSPDVNHGGPYRVLGMLYLMAPPWPLGIGDGDRALELLREAVLRHPGYPKNHIFFARALWELEGEEGTREIRDHLEEALRLVNREKWKTVRERWIGDLNCLAKEVGIEKQPSP